MWWRRRSAADFREEIEAHIAIEARALERERGLSPEDARRAARSAFGNVAAVQDVFHERRGGSRLGRFAQHAAYAVRTLARQPAFTLAAVATLAIGIGLLTAGFTLFYGFLVRQLPVHDADRLVHITQRWVEKGPRDMRSSGSRYSWSDYQVYRDRARSSAPALTSVAVYTEGRFVVGGVTDEVPGELVSCEYFAVAGARIAAGRAFAAHECDHPGAGQVVVLGHRLWSRYFGADSSVLGRAVRVNNVPLVVVGIAEPRFAGVQMQRAEMWIPATMLPTLAHGRDDYLTRRHAVWLKMIGRLAPGAAPEQAREELRLAARGLDAGSANVEGLVDVRTATFAYIGPSADEPRMMVAFTFLLGAVVALMGCVNVMNLLLARAIARRREIAIRLAIGASRGRLIEQLLVESIVLAMLAGVVGFAIAHTVPGIVQLVSPMRDLQVDVTPDGVVLAFALGIALATTLIFGLTPALQATSVDLTAAIRGTPGFVGRRIRPSRLRTATVASQVAGSTLLLVIAGLLVRAAITMAGVDPGLDPRNVFSLSLGLQRLGYTEERARQLHQQLAERLASTPGVTSVASARWLPLGGGSWERIVPEQGPGAAETGTGVFYNAVSGSYLETVRIPVVRGRVFTDSEARVSEPTPAVVSAEMARRLWPEAEPLGRLFRIQGSMHRVVGVAADSRGPADGPASAVIAYLPAHSFLGAQIVVRTAGPTAPIASAAAEWARVLDPAIVARTEMLEDRLDRQLAPARLTAGLAGSLGAIALSLAVVGIYGIVAFAASQRRREVALRMALGATRAGVVGLMMRQGARAVAIGLATGVALAAAASRGVRGLLYGVSPLDPAAYATMAGVIALATLVAMYLPSRRAARIDPARELRGE